MIFLWILLVLTLVLLILLCFSKKISFLKKLNKRTRSLFIYLLLVAFMVLCVILVRHTKDEIINNIINNNTETKQEDGVFVLDNSEAIPSSSLDDKPQVDENRNFNVDEAVDFQKK